MAARNYHLIVAVFAALLLSACGTSSDGGEDGVGVPGEPRLETDTALLDAALECTPFEHPDKPPVLLVHGTFTHGQEQYNWTYKPLLIERGFDVCTVTYPDRGFGDMQISAEYVVHALRRIRAESGRKVAVIGHSQGVAVPRWAIKWWPSARNAVEDFVMQAGPNRGADPVALFTLLGLVLPEGVNPLATPIPLPAAFRQLLAASEHMRVVNLGDETPGDIDYTALYTLFDELVQPVYPIPTAAIDFGKDNPKVANILLQDLCPGRIVDHVTIGLTDRVSFELALDAISNPGPANIERAGGSALCGLPVIPSQVLPANFLTQILGLLPIEIANGAPGLNLVIAEPPLKPYAQ